MSITPASPADTSTLSASVQHALAVTLRGCEELLPQDDWVKKLMRAQDTGQRLRIKLGLDPTAPDIHLGHTVVLNKLRQLQDTVVTGIIIHIAVILCRFIFIFEPQAFRIHHFSPFADLTLQNLIPSPETVQRDGYHHIR